MALELDSMLNTGLKGVTGFPGGSDGEDSACNVGDWGSILGREDPWRREQQPTPVFSSGESHRQRSLAGYSPWGPKEWNTTA